MRLRLAACMARAGEQDEAEIELLAARKPLEQACARFYLQLCLDEQRRIAGKSD